MEHDEKSSDGIVRKTYEVFHSIRRDGDFLFYEDYHSLICQIRNPDSQSFEPLGVKVVELDTCTIKGTYPKDYKPYVGKKAIDGLAKRVASSFQFSEGDEVKTHSRGGILNVIQFPLEDVLLEFFRDRLVQWTQEYQNSVLANEL